MNSWKEETQKFNETMGKIDFNDPNWKQTKSELIKNNDFHMDAEDFYNYCLMSIDYAKSHSYKEWFEYMNEKNTTWDDFASKENADIRWIKKMYRDAKSNIITTTAFGHNRLWVEELEEQELISNVKYLYGGQVIRFRVDVLI